MKPKLQKKAPMPWWLDQEREGPAAQSLRMVLGCLESGEQPPDWAVNEIVTALARYDNAEVSSIGEAFGFPWNKHLAARRSERRMAEIAAMVDHIQAEGLRAGRTIPLKSNRDRKGALDLAGERLNMSPAAVKKYRDQWLKICKDLGVNRRHPTDQATGNAGRIISSALSEALRPRARKAQKK